LFKKREIKKERHNEFGDIFFYLFFIYVFDILYMIGSLVILFDLRILVDLRCKI
jgi:hypothetical protein